MNHLLDKIKCKDSLHKTSPSLGLAKLLKLKKRLRELLLYKPEPLLKKLKINHYLASRLKACHSKTKITFFYNTILTVVNQ